MNILVQARRTALLKEIMDMPCERQLLISALIASGIALAACESESVAQMGSPKIGLPQEKIQMTAGNTARPGIIAVREEYDAALKANTIPAWELFIARHPESPWTVDARERLAKLQKKT